MTRSLYFSQSILTLSRLKVHLVFDNNVAVGPRTVEISGAEVPLSTGRNHILTCTSSGSRPPAKISWWRDGRRMKHSKQKVSTLYTGTIRDATDLTFRQYHPMIQPDLFILLKKPIMDGFIAWADQPIKKVEYVQILQCFFSFQTSPGGNVTVSEVVVSLTYTDNGRNVSCRAENTKLLNSPLAIRDTHIQLNVQCESSLVCGARLVLMRYLLRIYMTQYETKYC